MKMKTTYMAVIEYVHDNPGCTIQEVAAGTNVSYESAKRILSDEYANFRMAKTVVNDDSSNMSVWKWYFTGI